MCFAILELQSIQRWNSTLTCVLGLSCSSRPLVSLNMRLNEALVAIYKLSNGVVQGLLQTVRPQASALYAMVDSIALLDMLLR